MKMYKELMEDTSKYIETLFKEEFTDKPYICSTECWYMGDNIERLLTGRFFFGQQREGCSGVLALSVLQPIEPYIDGKPSGDWCTDIRMMLPPQAHFYFEDYMTDEATAKYTDYRTRKEWMLYNLKQVDAHLEEHYRLLDKGYKG